MIEIFQLGVEKHIRLVLKKRLYKPQSSDLYRAVMIGNMISEPQKEPAKKQSLVDQDIPLVKKSLAHDRMIDNFFVLHFGAVRDLKKFYNGATE